MANEEKENENEKGKEGEGYSLNLKTMKGATHKVTVTGQMTVRELKSLIAQVCFVCLIRGSSHNRKSLKSF